MGGGREISVLLLTYNPSDSDLRASLRSIAVQEGCDYQLLIVDDHSQSDPIDQIRSIADDLGGISFEYVRHRENLRTVHSVRAVLEQVTGKYTKLLGAGDELFDSSTLRTIVDFCDSVGALCGFGDIVLSGTGEPFCFPLNAADYPPHGIASQEILFKHQVRHADWVPGCSQFFETRFLAEMLTELADYYGVDYCEDFSETIALLKTKVWHLDSPIVRYDWGEGLSTNGSYASRKRLYADHLRFFSRIKADKPFDSSFLKPYCFFRIKRFIALRTPFYGLLKGLASMLRS